MRPGSTASIRSTVRFNDSQLIFNTVTCVIKAFFVTDGSEKKSPANDAEGSEEKNQEVH